MFPLVPCNAVHSKSTQVLPHGESVSVIDSSNGAAKKQDYIHQHYVMIIQT